MKRSSNFITNIVITLFIVLGFVGMTLILSAYSRIYDTSVQSRNYLQQDAIYMHELETDLSIVINLGRVNADENAEKIKEYLEKIDSTIAKCESVVKLYDGIERITDEEEDKYYKVKLSMDKYNDVLVNGVISQINKGYYETANTMYFQQFIPERDQLDEYINDQLNINEKNFYNEYSKVERNTKGLRLFFTLFGVILLIMINVLNFRREKMNKNLQKAVETNQKAKKSLDTAVFNDILTDVKNRMAFVTEYSKGFKTISKDEIYYFAMFNIDGFNAVNINYGVESGDLILNSTASRLKKAFDGFDIYRTGSDEFVVIIKEKYENQSNNRALQLIGNAVTVLQEPHSIDGGRLAVKYSVSVVSQKGASEIDFSVIEVLKDTMNINRDNFINEIHIRELN